MEEFHSHAIFSSSQCAVAAEAERLDLAPARPTSRQQRVQVIGRRGDEWHSITDKFICFASATKFVGY